MPQQRQGTDPMQLLMGLMQMRQQREQGEENRKVQQEGIKQGGIQMLLTMSRNAVTPGRADALATLGENMGWGKKGDILAAISEIAPTTEAIQANDMIRGRNMLAGIPSSTPDGMKDLLVKGATSSILGRGTGEQAQQDYTASLFSAIPSDLTKSLAPIFAVRNAAGVLPGQLAMDTATSELPKSELMKGARIGIGTEMNAGAAGQYKLGTSDLVLRDYIARSGSALEEAKLLLSKNAMGTGGLTFEDVPKLMATKQQLQADLAKAATTGLTEAQKQEYLSSLQQINLALQKLGLPTTQITPSETGQVFKPLSQRFGDLFGGNTQTNPVVTPIGR